MAKYKAGNVIIYPGWNNLTFKVNDIINIKDRDYYSLESLDGNYQADLTTQFVDLLWHPMSGDPGMVIKNNGLTEPDPSSLHTHHWKQYNGFTESYQYCTICDEKRK